MTMADSYVSGGDGAPIPEALARRGRDPLGDAVFRSSEVRVIPERDGAHIPSFYQPHESPSETVVTQDGSPLPAMGGRLQFTVADVAPERRWAITESGELLQQHVFESKLLLVREEWFERVAHVAPPGKLQNEVIPTVARYVSLTPDPIDPSKLVPIGFDPSAQPDPDAPRLLYDAKKDKEVTGEERLAMLVEAYERPLLRKTLRPHEIDEVEVYLRKHGRHVGSGDDLVSKLTQLNEMLSAGDITTAVHSRRVAELTGTAEVEPDPKTEETRDVPDVTGLVNGTLDTRAREKPKRKTPVTRVPCGEEVPSLQSRRHQDKCPVCQQHNERKDE